MSQPQQTPEQLLAELETLGEVTVRRKLELGHFASYKVPLVQGWLDRLEQGRQQVVREKEAAARKARADERATAVANVAEALRTARRSQMLALAALIVASVGLMLAILGFAVS